MRDAGLEQAIKAAGGISALARRLGVAQPSISNWSKVPAERVLAVESITAVSRTVLRPDLYPADREDHADLDPVEEARGKIYLVLANVLLRVPQDAVLAELARLEPGEGEIGHALSALAEAAGRASGESVAREHFNLFVGVGRGELLPYASYYLTGFLYERPLVRVRDDLKILGLARDESVSEPEDGMGFMCEVMAGLALGRFAAAETFQRTFFERNLRPWAEKFFADLEKAEGAIFYRAVGRLGRVFMELEREAFALNVDQKTGVDQRRTQLLEGSDERQAS
jgi:TorA maturation chaperone TorD